MVSAILGGQLGQFLLVAILTMAMAILTMAELTTAKLTMLCYLGGLVVVVLVEVV